MKSKKPLSDKEREAFEASRDMGKSLLKLARQMVAGRAERSGCVTLIHCRFVGYRRRVLEKHGQKVFALCEFDGD